jgi:hypothetical protein
MAELLGFGEFRTIDLSSLSPARLSSGNLIVEEGVY